MSLLGPPAQTGINRHKFQSHTVMTKYLGDGFTQHLVDNAGGWAYVLLTSMPCFFAGAISSFCIAHHDAVSPTAATPRVLIQLHARRSVGEVCEGVTSRVRGLIWVREEAFEGGEAARGFAVSSREIPLSPCVAACWIGCCEY